MLTRRLTRGLVFALAITLTLPGAAAQLGNPAPGHVAENAFTLPARLDAIRAISPDFVTVEKTGTSVGGLDILTVDVHHPNASAEALPVYYLDGGHHGNEQYAVESVLFFLEELARWSTTPEGAARLSEVRVVATPVVNPDGLTMDKRTNSRNVDLNRNYDYHWGLYGTEDHPASFTYHGESAESEPETQANAALLRELRPDLYFSTHTGSHDIVLPWRADEDGAMPDWPVYEKLLAAIEDVSGLGYRDPSGAGESISFGYGALGAVSLIIEVSTTQFVPASGEDLHDVLREEIDIMWLGLEVFEKLGGHLAFEGDHPVNRALDADHLVNDGWAAALNVTFLDAHGNVLRAVEDAVPANGTVKVPEGAARVTWETRVQGDEARPVRDLDLAALTGETRALSDGGALDVPVPWWAPLVALALAGAAREVGRRLK